ncbi:vesicle coat component [Mortierella alpina]|nr:vesicle coat component [Mortierella alpina]
MTRLNFSTSCVALTLVLMMLVRHALAIKFELAGRPSSDPEPFCVSHYVDDDTQVVVKVKVGSGPHQKISLEITDDSEHQNQLWRKDSLSEELQRATFLTKQAGEVVACFTNSLTDGTQPDPRYTRTVDIDFDIGSETIDYAKLAETEKLKPLELELRKLEDLVKDILDNMDHLQQREEGMRNTNESTNARVQWFSTLTMVILVTLGLWQIFYLKRFFRKKRLID